MKAGRISSPKVPDLSNLVASNYPVALPSSGNNEPGSTPRNAIGVIIPLSGKWESVGQKILKGIEIADGVFSNGPAQNIEYIIRDYGNNEDSIPSIIDELDRTQKVVAIIGPVGEHAGDIACKEAQARHLPAIIFTQAEMPPKIGTYCYRNFLTIDLQAKALLNAARSMGIRRFAVMIPDDRFGKTFAEKFQRLSPSFGITILKSITYSPQSVDFKQQLKILFSGDKKTPAKGRPGDISLGKGTDIEAILIPDTATNAAMIASYISYLNIKNIRLFGPTLWDTPELLKAGGRYIENAVFLSGFYHGTILSAAQDFNRSFTNTFHYTPSVWEACAFDVAQILQAYTQSQRPSREALKDYLASLKDYHGVSGTTSFSSDGALEKTTYLLTIKDGSIYEIHP
jgi:ABC-type branched-subunit amino acid transport system substrate-binding protein